MATVLGELDSLSSNQAISNALNTVVPVTDSGLTTASYSTLNQFIQTAVGRVQNIINTASISEGLTGISTGDSLKGVDIWAQGFGTYAHQSKRGTSNGYNANVYGGALGADRSLRDDKTRIGLSGGYAQTFVRSKDNSGRTDIDSYQANIYGGFHGDTNPYYLDWAFSFAYNNYDGSRHITVGAIERTADSDYNGQQYSAFVEGGYLFNMGKLMLTPLVSLHYMHLYVDSYEETNAGALNLKVEKQNYDLLQSGLGAKLEAPMNCKNGTFIPEVHFRWLYDFVGDKQQTTSTFTGGGGSFKTEGFNPAKASYDLGAKITFLTKNNITFAVDYDCEIKEDFYSHSGLANVKYSF
ncbi:MAG: hypothetical protein COS99_03235 [Candidatus Omnitrophica bacterium CG07_land_8_20_14_0_80_42_15]|uniref:Autotransporter domain-containing protein n=1 Tax=Candidatus Aquitaenariimonas noxiae TaxID=1974741 RepID=A0A2J0KTH6_9BACT|nr:MAG: hypothetical protein COS99_03235 [Candidatus Omnitrophica bacterium CG07_land_8_20_14_0_80_42_15]